MGLPIWVTRMRPAFLSAICCFLCSVVFSAAALSSDLRNFNAAPGRYRADYLNIASYTFRIGKDGYKPAQARVRALGAAALADLEGSTPGIKIDVAVPVRLEPAPTD